MNRDDLEREHAALEDALTALAPRVEFPPAPDLAPAVRARLETLPAPRLPWWRRLAPGDSRARPGLRRPAVVALALVVVAALLVAALPGPREAVADLLGVRGVRIERGGGEAPEAPARPEAPAPGPPPTFEQAALGELVGLEEARAAVDYPVPLPAGLGPPDAVRVNRDVPGGMVSLAWLPRQGLPDPARTGTGLLLIAFRGQVQETWAKVLPEGAALEEVAVGGAPGRWIEGAPHVLTFEDAGGDGRTVHGRLAGNTLLWSRDGVTWRLEAGVSRERAVQIATSLR